MELWLVFVLSLGVAAGKINILRFKIKLKEFLFICCVTFSIGSSVEVQSSEDGSENWRKPYVSLVPQARLNFAGNFFIKIKLSQYETCIHFSNNP
jgi:hypothetical protein